MSLYTIPSSSSLAAIEYPAPLSPSDIPHALATLGGIDTLTKSLHAPPSSSSSSSSSPSASTDHHHIPIHLQLSPHNPYFHPIEGSLSTDTKNILIRVKSRNGSLTSVEPVGLVDKLVRFRAMADFQYLPDNDDSAVKASQAIRSLDVSAIQSDACDRLDDDDDTYQQLPQDSSPPPPFLPPPVFSRSAIASIYDFKQNTPIEQVSRTSKSTGQEYSRLTYTTPYQTVPQIQVPFSAPSVPPAPTPDMLNSPAAKKIDPLLLDRITQLLQTRPVWSRQALINQLDDDLANHAINYKAVWGMTTYTFSDGPFRELNIRFGFDPRVDVSSRIYQRITLRNVANYRNKNLPPTTNTSSASTSSTTTKTNSSSSTSSSSLRDRETHLFDGLKCRNIVATFQIIDITDPLITSIANNQNGWRSQCDFSTGWYTPQVDQILRQALKRKHDALVKGLVISDIDMQDLMMALPSPSLPNQ